MKYFVFNLLLLSTILISCSDDKKAPEEIKQEQSAIFSDSDTAMVDITSLDSDFVIDVRYATENNFTGEVLYPVPRVFLRKAAAMALVDAHKELKESGMRFLVFDGYRPVSVQEKMWEIMPDERYVADPKKGSRHNRGAAVDLTIVDSLGNPLDMGTDYDDFTEKATPDYADVSDEVKENRQFLVELMKRHGFSVYPTEWWHYDFANWEEFEIIEFDITQ